MSYTEEFLGVHFRRNVMDQTPPPLRDRMHDRLDAILTASAPAPAREVLDATLDALDGEAETALRVLEDGFDDATAVLALPPKYRRRRYLTMDAFFAWEHAQTHPDRTATALPQAA